MKQFRRHDIWTGPSDRRSEFLANPKSIEVDGTVLFRGVQRELVSEGGGVYLIHDLRGVLYVGRSIELRRRFDEHRLRCDNEFLMAALQQPFGDMRFSWIRTTSERETMQLEASLIAWLQPACNRLNPSLKSK